ncbi:FERM domain-containing protein 4A [Liparis tanakae]|uniref:FERM domain-containing protein 4A n=1 Tax=Liparis tanakae TaxID=230148 RepID=A0A4Z2H0W3_9TELE|nr:FERM domain-containing protein 4A [Liparis tanakae]
MTLVCFPERKHKERMAELQERRRGLQALLSTRLAELRRICLQEAELTGAVPTDFPLEAGERPPCVRRRGGTSRQGNRKSRSEVRHDGGSRPLLVSSGSPVVLFQNKTRRSSLHIRSDLPETLQTLKPLPLHSPPPRSQDSSSSSGPSDTGPAGGGGVMVNCLLDRIALLQDEAGPHRGGMWARGTNAAAAFRSAETLTEGQTRASNGQPSGRGEGRGEEGRGEEGRGGAGHEGEGRGGAGNEGEGRGGAGHEGAAYSDVLLDYVWGKQQQLHLQQPHSRHPIASQHELLFHGSSPEPLGAPPTYRDQRRVKVTRTKSCGPFLPVQQGQSPPAAIQPDPHPHLLPPRPPQLPPRPPQLPPAQDAQLEDATRSLHKALALEGLRDWYLRNTNSSTHPNQANGKVNVGVNTKVNWGVKGQAGEGGALQSRRRTRGVLHHELQPHEKTLTHSATFHGRSVDSSPPQEDQPSPGTLV